jgi:hypothetical protein
MDRTQDIDLPGFVTRNGSRSIEYQSEKKSGRRATVLAARLPDFIQRE